MFKPFQTAAGLLTATALAVFCGCGDKYLSAPGGALALDAGECGVTYQGQIKALLSSRCTTCHSGSGARAGVNLDSYDGVSHYAEHCLEHMTDGTMPPSSPLPDSEIAIFAAWLDNGGQYECKTDGSDGGVAGGDGGVALTCTTGRHGSNEGSPEMAPGKNCISCHLSGGHGEDEEEIPKFTVAGTVMGGFNEEDLCVGVSGVTVELTGADGAVLKLATNSAGNFFSTRAFRPPFSARLVSGAGERRMLNTQSNANCMDCHTAAGAGGAPGRIVAP